MGQFSFWHLILVFGIVLVVFGPGRLPTLGHSLGKAIRGFKEGLKGLDEGDSEARPVNPNPDRLSQTDQKDPKNPS
jgi:sec-independent protein translocase protein TatA